MADFGDWTTPVTRRHLLRSAALGGAALGAADLLAACGGSSSTGKTTTTAIPSTRKKGGLLRIGLATGGPTETFDPHRMVLYTDWAHAFNTYDLLCYPDPASGYKLQNHLAEEFSHNTRGDVWTIRLRSGVTFHNGKPLTADDLVFSIHRMLASDTDTVASLSFIDPKGVKKIDKMTVQLKLPKPFAEVDYAFAASNQFIVPVGFDPKKPIGTGPFKLEQWKPGDHAEFSANTNYWGEGPFVDHVNMIVLNDDTARVNALQNGQVDAIQQVPLTQVSSLQGGGSIKILKSPSCQWNPFTMRVDQKPFDDVRVRQAFRLIANRPQLIESAILGEGRLANDLYMPYDPVYDSSLPQRHQDIEQAKSLLKQAGYGSGLTVQLTTGEIAPGLNEASQIFAQQAKQAGVTVNLRQLNPTEFESVANGYFKYNFAVDTEISSWSYLTTASLWDGPNAPFSETKFADPQFDSLFRQATQTMDTTKRTELCHEMQKIQYDRGGYLIWSFATQVDAYSSKLVGYVPDKTGWPMNTFGYNRLSFT